MLMSERTNKTQVLAIVLLAIIIVISILAVVLFTGNSEGITAMEAIEISDEYANNWNVNSALINIGITDYFEGPSYIPDGKNGHYNEWYCVYAVPSTNSTNASSISLKVCSNGTVTELIINNNSGIFEYGNEFISNWTIDSDEAYEIAWNYVDTQDWLEQHPESYIQFFSINHMDYTVWHITWMDKSDSNYGFMSVGIVADTGEVIVSVT